MLQVVSNCLCVAYITYASSSYLSVWGVRYPRLSFFGVSIILFMRHKKPNGNINSSLLKDYNEMNLKFIEEKQTT